MPSSSTHFSNLTIDILNHVHIDALISMTVRRIRGRKFTHLLIHIYFHLNITIMKQRPRIEYQQCLLQNFCKMTNHGYTMLINDT